ncbi:hypothetical protein [Paraliomyxa miuraensis]|uniref:hypothetical protein n=1 Tax=Paraliomyxa miuraensis TaxID=376150 RepID=UPI00224CFD51|nr:hypothetical protein [Paraliomyxa miuraensis]MCX4239580.1 hypothetical protein [Paraliomyxa miuraensis]
MFVAQHSTPDSHVAHAHDAPPPMVYEHVKRAQWGLAALLWEQDGKRGYRFEDGSERVFSEGYYHLLEPRPAIGETAEKLLASVHRETGSGSAGASANRASAVSKPVPPTLEELVAVFHETYAGGFSDPRWQQQVRGEGAKRRTKKHREPAVHDAKQRLDRDTLDELLAQGNAAEVLARAVAVLGATDLVTATQLEVLRGATPSLALAHAIRDLVHEPDPEGVAFDRACTLIMRARGKPPSWPLLSGLRALVHPGEDVCIRPSVFFGMVGVIAPYRARKVTPQGLHYRHLSGVARELREQLVAMGEQPRDMLDVHDFIWETCRPSAAPLLERVRLRAIETAAASSRPSSPAVADAPGADEEEHAEAA